jgi:site-specific recombinase XerD
LSQPKLIDQVRSIIRVKHNSLRTEEAYWHWIKRFILFHKKRHPNEMGEPEVSAFLSHLAVEKKVAASTQNQALSALLFLYKEVLKAPLDWIEGIQRAKRPSRLAVVFTAKIQAILRNLEGTKWRVCCMARAFD